MSEYNTALSAMVNIAGGIVPEKPYQELRDSADKALKHWIQDIINQPSRAVPTERRAPHRVKGPAFKRMEPVEHFPAVKAV
jgi:hypothetical protein